MAEKKPNVITVIDAAIAAVNAALAG